MFASKKVCQIFVQVEEDFVPAPSLLLPLLGGSAEEKQEADPGMKTRMGEMARTEWMILKTLNFHLRRSTASTFLHYFTQVGMFEKKKNKISEKKKTEKRKF